MDQNSDGKITVADLRTLYTVKHHPKFQSGELAEEDILKDFLSNFDHRHGGQETKGNEWFIRPIECHAVFSLILYDSRILSHHHLILDSVTKEDFINYYSTVSASIDNDAYFDLMVRRAYKL